MRWLFELLARFRRRSPPPPLLSLSEREPADAASLRSGLEVVPPPVGTAAPPPLASEPEVPEPAPAAPAAPVIAFAPPEAYAPSAPVVELEEEVETRDFEEEADAEVDPFDGAEAGPSLDVRLLQALDEIPARRAAARAAALEGPHRIALTDAAGPGSLAEALVELEREGGVVCRVETDAAGEPHLSYVPVSTAASPAEATPEVVVDDAEGVNS